MDTQRSTGIKKKSVLMGRTNGEFQNGTGKVMVGYHVSSNSNRDSIEKTGLVSSWVGNDRRAKATKGVFFSTDKEYLDDFGGVKSDIWKVTVPIAGIEEDSHKENAFYSKDDIPRRNVERVGHFTKAPESDNKFAPYLEIHWHKEENCPNE